MQLRSHQQCGYQQERFIIITVGPPFRPGKAVAFSFEGDVIVRAGRWVRDYKADHTVSGSMVDVGETTPEGSLADTITCVRQQIPLHTNYQYTIQPSQPSITQHFIVAIGLFLVTRFFAAKILSEKMKKKKNRQETKTLKDRNTG